VEKVLVAQRLRQETTVSLKWIAQQLEMGSWTHVANRLRELRQFRLHVSRVEKVRTDPFWMDAESESYASIIGTREA